GGDDTGQPLAVRGPAQREDRLVTDGQRDGRTRVDLADPDAGRAGPVGEERHPAASGDGAGAKSSLIGTGGDTGRWLAGRGRRVVRGG
ncbi:hypothetical protein JNW90_14140, partial [Micromonospora sp. STR1s_5]|nr:hypothetical protein [Micromonospora sp. STR1s_5]